MGFVESVGDFAAGLQYLVGGKRTFLQALGEGQTFNEFHDQVARAIL